MAVSSFLRRRNLGRLALIGIAFVVLRTIFSPRRTNQEIQHHNVLERVTRRDKSLDVQRHEFLQVRMGRDDRKGIFDDIIADGVKDYWDRFQYKFITSKETSHVDAQVVRSSIEDLLGMNGWVTASCSTLHRPFGQNRREEAWDELVAQNHLYYVAIIIHSADHFLVDQLAVIVQMARRLGPQNLFVSMVDYDSTDATPTLLDLCEAVLTLLAVPFRIRYVSRMTEDVKASYYPMEEAYTRNMALEPLWELKDRRGIHFHRVIWLKGFTCPSDIVETIKVSEANEAAMVCGMDWAEHNKFFIFSDRWRTRDMDGDQFRRAKSSAPPDAGPTRDKISTERYNLHLPFQVFCCESGTHVVDPFQSYYRGLKYRHGTGFHNSTLSSTRGEWDSKQPCQDSSQAWFCRDLWVDAAKDGDQDPRYEIKADAEERRPVKGKKRKRAAAGPDEEAKAGSDADAIPEGEIEELQPEDDEQPSIPNAAFRAARILINPRCVTTYAGVSHTQLALDLFGSDREKDDSPEYDKKGGKYVLEDWEGAPESFVCQEQRQTGGRKASKTQRRVNFAIHKELQQGR